MGALARPIAGTDSAAAAAVALWIKRRRVTCMTVSPMFCKTFYQTV